MPKKLTLEEFQIIAENRGGICLSTEYINSVTKLQYQCSEGHIFSQRPTRTKQGDWCRTCGNKRSADVRRDPIGIYQKIAKSRDGECLSEDYVVMDGKRKLLFECKYGHQWYARPSDIKHKNSWCPGCWEKRKGKHQLLTIEQMQDIALEKGGWCLSPEYFRQDHKLWWQCGEGHIWDAVARNLIHNNAWCPYCRKGKTGYNIKSTIEEIREIAESKKGKCLSETYIDDRTKLLFECEVGHIFLARPHTIKKGHWCPVCSSGISERACRIFFENIFNKKFPKKRPKWLLSEKGHRMELDGYCEELGLAFEYQGEQHYSDDFYKDKKRKLKLKVIQKRDKQKKMFCEKNHVALIAVPYYVQYDEMQDFIIEQCKKYDVQLPDKIKKIDYRNFNIYPMEHLNYAREYAEKKGGKCLSNTCIDRDQKLQFECAKGHIFWTTPHSLKSMKTWCPTCGGRPVYTINDMKKIAKNKGGICLSDQYINSSTKLIWQCSEGHIWKTAPSNVVQGQWCPECYKMKRKRNPIEYKRNYQKFPHEHTF